MLLCPAIFMDTVVNSNCIVMVDAVAITSCWQMLCLGFVADVITTLCCCVVWQMKSYFGRCYSYMMVDFILNEIWFNTYTWQEIPMGEH